MELLFCVKDKPAICNVFCIPNLAVVQLNMALWHIYMHIDSVNLLNANWCWKCNLMAIVV